MRIVDNLNQLLVLSQIAHDAADWSSLIQYLQQLILGKDVTHPEIAKNREYLLELALSILEMGDFLERWEIAKVFTYLGNIAIAPLIEILEDEEAEEEVKWYAARILGEFQHPDAIAVLVELLRSVESQELKAIASTALSQIGTPAIAALSQLLIEENTRLLAVRSLCYMRHTETITPLLSVVQDPQTAVRSAAIEALRSFDDEPIPSVLVNALNDQSATVRRAAVSGLGCRPDLREALDLVNKIQPKLDDLSQDVACAAIAALSRLGGDEAVKQLFHVLISPQAPLQLQLEAIRALSWLGTASSLKYFQQAVNHSISETLCQEIVTVMGLVQEPQLTTLATEILLEMLQSQHPANIKNAIALSLGQLGKIEAIGPLILLLADQNILVRLHAIAALKNLAPEAAYQ